VCICSIIVSIIVIHHPMQNLATVCDAQGNLARAGSLLTEALSIEEQV
jgi:hypothetical protein